MEFKLNKIDTEVRQIINDATKEGKIHTKKDPKVNKDKNSEKNKYEEEKKPDNRQRKKFIIDAIKVKNVKVSSFREPSSDEYKTKGAFLDIKR